MKFLPSLLFFLIFSLSVVAFPNISSRPPRSSSVHVEVDVDVDTHAHHHSSPSHLSDDSASSLSSLSSSSTPLKKIGKHTTTPSSSSSSPSSSSRYSLLFTASAYDYFNYPSNNFQRQRAIGTLTLLDSSTTPPTSVSTYPALSGPGGQGLLANGDYQVGSPSHSLGYSDIKGYKFGTPLTPISPQHRSSLEIHPIQTIESPTDGCIGLYGGHDDAVKFYTELTNLLSTNHLSHIKLTVNVENNLNIIDQLGDYYSSTAWAQYKLSHNGAHPPMQTAKKTYIFPTVSHNPKNNYQMNILMDANQNTAGVSSGTLKMVMEDGITPADIPSCLPTHCEWKFVTNGGISPLTDSSLSYYIDMSDLSQSLPDNVDGPPASVTHGDDWKTSQYGVGAFFEIVGINDDVKQNNGQNVVVEGSGVLHTKMFIHALRAVDLTSALSAEHSTHNLGIYGDESVSVMAFGQALRGINQMLGSEQMDFQSKGISVVKINIK